MIEELIENAREELKRADHSLYVSLKYTRTVDVIKGTIKRLINAIDIGIQCALEHLKEKKKLKLISDLQKLRAESLAKLLPEFKDYIDFYFLLKTIDKAEYNKREEYRKNVTLIAHVKINENIEVDINTLKEYCLKTIEFVNKVEAFVKI